MRKLYNKFFLIPKNGKIRDEVMLMRLIMTVTIVVMCLVAMSFSSYAYFTYSVSSGSNTITAASFDIEVEIKNKDELIKDDNYKSIVLGPGEYEIKVKKTGMASTGYAEITITGENINNEIKYTTDQIPEEISFSITTDKKITLSFIANWGTSTKHVADKNGEEVEFFIKDTDTINLSVNKEENSEPTNDNVDESISIEESTAPAEEKTTASSSENSTNPSTNTKPNSTVNNETTTTTPESTTLPSPETTSQEIPETTPTDNIEASVELERSEPLTESSDTVSDRQDEVTQAENTDLMEQTNPAVDSSEIADDEE